MGYDQHLFISYAHLDNERGWVDRFHALFEPLLKSRLGRETRIWRDRKLAGNDVFADEIEHQLCRSALMLSVVTPRYVDSAWCRREAATFCEAADRDQGVVVDRKLRIFKVVLIPPDSQDPLPAPMKDALGFPFYEVKDEEPLELDPRYGTDFAAKLELALAQLASKVTRSLKQVEAAAAGEAAGTAAAPARSATAVDKPVVYLAECSRDRNADRMALQTELESRGYRVLPDIDMPTDETGYRDQVQAQLARCRLAVHLIGSGYGAEPSGPQPRSVVELQHELSMQLAGAGRLRRLLWVPEGLQPQHPRQQAFIEALHGDPLVHASGDLITGAMAFLKERMWAEIARLEAPPPPPVAPAAADRAGAAQPSLYFICNEADLPATVALRKALKAADVQVFKPEFDDGESAEEVRLANERMLQACDAVLVYYGGGTRGWYLSVMKALEKALATRQRAFLARFVWVAGPTNSVKDDMVEAEEVPDLVDGREGYRPELLAPVLATLARAGTAAGANHG
jgi:hypothetical protein